MKYGSKNKRQVSDDYRFVFEDQVDCIKASVMDGHKFDYGQEIALNNLEQRDQFSRHFRRRGKSYLSILFRMNFSKLFMITKYLSLLVKLVPEKLHRFLNIFMKLVTQSMEE